MNKENKNLWQRMEKKEKILMVIAVLIMLSNLFYYEVYKGNARNVKYESIYSTIYNKNEVTDAIELIRQDFKDNYKGCKMEKIKYSDKYLKEQTGKLKKQDRYKGKDIIVFNVDFKAGKIQGFLDHNLKVDQKIKDSDWVLVRENKNSPWTVSYREN